MAEASARGKLAAARSVPRRKIKECEYERRRNRWLGKTSRHRRRLLLRWGPGPGRGRVSPPVAGWSVIGDADPHKWIDDPNEETMPSITMWKLMTSYHLSKNVDMKNI